MSRRDLSQPSFVDSLVSGYGKVGGFLNDPSTTKSVRHARLPVEERRSDNYNEEIRTFFLALLDFAWSHSYFN
jgi:hypothetical protein